MTIDFTPESVERALAGDPEDRCPLIQHLLPVIEVAVICALRNDARASRHDMREEALDFVQEIVVSLLKNEGKVLRSWDPARGCSLENFIRLIARRHVSASLRSGRRCPWADKRIDTDDFERVLADSHTTPAEALEHSDTLEWLIGRLRTRLSERGMRLFTMLYVQECSVQEVMEATAMTRDAVYAWRLRFRKLVAPLELHLERGSSVPLLAKPPSQVRYSSEPGYSRMVAS